MCLQLWTIQLKKHYWSGWGMLFNNRLWSLLHPNFIVLLSQWYSVSVQAEPGKSGQKHHVNSLFWQVRFSPGAKQRATYKYIGNILEIYWKYFKWKFLVTNIIAMCYTHQHSWHYPVMSSGYSWKKTCNFSSDHPKSVIFLQPVLFSVYRYIPSSEINAYVSGRTLFSEGLNVSPKSEISA